MLTLYAMIALGICEPSASIAPDPEGRVTIGSSTYFASNDPLELERQLKRSFDLTDRNGDGYVDLNEAPIAERGQRREDGFRVAAEASNTLWIRTIDTNSDNLVDWSEMRAHFLPRLVRANTAR